MRLSSPLTALSTAGLLLVATVASTAAATDDGTARGSVKWYGGGDTSDVRYSSFRVVDGTPGSDSRVGDSGWYYLSRKGVGTLVLEVSCVRVDDGWAEFAGTVARATGAYAVDSWFLVSVVDTRNGREDAIGMGGKKPTLDAACDAATDEVNAFGRQGDVYRGRIRVNDPS